MPALPPKSDPTPRLSVLLASEAPVGIIFRRGPSKRVHVILWDRKHDRFKPGSWFQGRIYPDQSDVSPDGRHLLYFAMGGVRWAIPETGGTWTAISQVPKLKAIALWGQRGGTRGGGGVFTSNRSYWIDLTPETVCLRDDSGMRREEWSRPASRMEREGWKKRDGGYTFEKALPKGWILRRHSPYSSSPRHELEQPEDGNRLAFPDWEWADWDRTRLVWAESGKVRAAQLGSHKLGTVRTLKDFGP
jgi:hypothetical protein